MADIYENDYSLLEKEGWTTGAHWSTPGFEGYYIMHPEHTKGEYVKVSHSPCSEDSLHDGEGFIAASGPCDTASEALLERIGNAEEEEVAAYDDAD